MAKILGLNAYHGDASACLIIDGKLIAAAEEERFRRIKHWAGFPSEAVKYCLRAGGITIDQVEHIAINRNPSANLMKKVLFSFTNSPSISAVADRLKNAAKVRSIQDVMSDLLKVPREAVKAKIHNIEHHRAHLASTFFVSPFDSAAILSVDGFGDFVSTMWGVGKGNKIDIKDQVNFPHSLGLFYLAMTQYLGFMNYGDEYKVMGLAPYGKVTEMNLLGNIVKLKPNGRFELELSYFVHHSKGVSMVWEGGEPKVDNVFSEKLVELMGPPRKPNEPLTERHKNLAASMQAMYEKCFFHILEHIYNETKNPDICLAGGCAMNSVANGKIFNFSKFKNVYIQSAAGDAGGAIGAAFAVWNEEMQKSRSFVMDHAYYGPEFSDGEIAELLENRKEELDKHGCKITRLYF